MVCEQFEEGLASLGVVTIVLEREPAEALQKVQEAEEKNGGIPEGEEKSAGAARLPQESPCLLLAKGLL